MRIMIDTNVILSALLFPSERMNVLMDKVTREHQLVLSSFIVGELMEVTRRKFKNKVEAMDVFLSQLPYELVYTPEQPKAGLFEIRDENDYPVLYSAIVEDVDVFITGDKDFTEIDIERPEILTPSGFLQKY